MGWLIPKGTPAKNFYGGFGMGVAKSDAPDGNQDGSVSDVNTDETGVAAGVFLGYQLFNFLAIQGGYQDLGKSEFSGTSSGGTSWAPGPVSTKQEAHGWELGVMGRWPISNRWYVLGFVGWFWWESKETYSESFGTGSVTESGSDVTYAVGFEFDHGLKDRIVYRFMASHHEVGNDNYDVTGVSAAVVYRFP
jgi:OOP family OmpA-OmpF porin